VSRYVLEDGLFRAVVLDDVGNVGVKRLVVGDSGAEGVGESDVAGAIGVEEAGDAEDGVAAEGEWVDEVVVDAAVDDVDAAQTGSRAHVDDVVVGDEIAAFDQLDSHLAGEIGVFVVGGVEDAGREQDDVRFGSAFGGERAQGSEQQLRVLLDGTNVVAAEELGKDALHDAAIGEHVTYAGGNAEIVLEDDELAVLEADEIGSADGDVDVARDLKPDHLTAEVLAGVDEVAGNDAVSEDASFVVDVLEEEVERGDALGETALDRLPFGAGDDARDEIVGEDLFGAFVASVDGEGDALIEEAEVSGLLAAAQLVGG
jgi:hypothetical protein